MKRCSQCTSKLHSACKYKSQSVDPHYHILLQVRICGENGSECGTGLTYMYIYLSKRVACVNLLWFMLLAFLVLWELWTQSWFKITLLTYFWHIWRTALCNSETFHWVKIDSLQDFYASNRNLNTMTWCSLLLNDIKCINCWCQIPSLL